MACSVVTPYHIHTTKYCTTLQCTSNNTISPIRRDSVCKELLGSLKELSLILFTFHDQRSCKYYIIKLTFMRWILPDISINRLFACGWRFHYKPSLGSISGRLRVRHSKFSESLTHFPCWALLMWSSYMNGEKNLKKCRIPFKQKQSCVPPLIIHNSKIALTHFFLTI